MPTYQWLWDLREWAVAEECRVKKVRLDEHAKRDLKLSGEMRDSVTADDQGVDADRGSSETSGDASGGAENCEGKRVRLSAEGSACAAGGVRGGGLYLLRVGSE
ncbi:hypothetical protein NDU88_002809 [Pleurodeles waltl]|uniref:Uncharacterized protein n=1 Tax=Pleurodeles waltl TaxID=8319 RepID=A0AAV7LDF4_PLEWA|nr:hypothetical protein NDU88_002809 [Pleurodeles waltl]